MSVNQSPCDSLHLRYSEPTVTPRDQMQWHIGLQPVRTTSSFMRNIETSSKYLSVSARNVSILFTFMLNPAAHHGILPGTYIEHAGNPYSCRRKATNHDSHQRVLSTRLLMLDPTYRKSRIFCHVRFLFHETLQHHSAVHRFVQLLFGRHAASLISEVLLHKSDSFACFGVSDGYHHRRGAVCELHASQGRAKLVHIVAVDGMNMPSERRPILLGLWDAQNDLGRAVMAGNCTEVSQPVFCGNNSRTRTVPPSDSPSSMRHINLFGLSRILRPRAMPTYPVPSDPVDASTRVTLFISG